jgi:hypothetical protein
MSHEAGGRIVKPQHQRPPETTGVHSMRGLWARTSLMTRGLLNRELPDVLAGRDTA